MGTVDLVIRGGTIVDGDGGEPFEADLAVEDGRIAAIGPRLAVTGAEEMDARGRIVTPGFIDVHTHYDGQATWSDRLAPSSDHGVTTVLIGNCGVGFAPCHPQDREALVNVMEGVEDIPEAVMAEGLPWNWETFPQFMDMLAGRNWDINVGALIPHSPLRVYVMGQRGLDRETATQADREQMAALVAEGMAVGAFGFATSRSLVHRRGDGAYIPSFQADAEELDAIAVAVGRTGRGVLQLIPDFGGEGYASDVELLKRMASSSQRPVTYSLAQWSTDPQGWRRVMDTLAAHNESNGTRIAAQVFPRPMGAMCGLATSANPFTYCPSYDAIAALPLERKVEIMRDSAFRQKLLAEQPGETPTALHSMLRKWDALYPLGAEPDYEPPREASIAARAAALGVEPAALAYDLMLEDEGRALILMPFSNYSENSLEPVHAMMTHRDSIIGLGDGGAHYGIICDASYPTTLLAYWTRDRRGNRIPLAHAVRAMTADNADFLGLADRGRLRPGLRADINVIDHAALRIGRPHVVYDLPGGGRRMAQEATGYAATIVSGVAIQRDGHDTGARPGRLIRAA